ncbi:fimbrial protein pilin [Candidatus Saccharibacteria bacterium RAAC3_TM7_1]|nr:fimbrial protein pilin [Candidatus Saccharibacteria bacterium RAAC3_TM7_1]HCZ28388.1 prepilin-type N-terminal cleavage/methylation domain-containing protein [Candidatus Saccharibacteria bacterium]
MVTNMRGFTIVELLIVIVVIAILTAVTSVTYNGVQSRARDAERQQDMLSVQKVLEMYYIDNGFFPNTVDIRDPVWRKAHFASQDQGIFINPQDSSASPQLTQ